MRTSTYLIAVHLLIILLVTGASCRKMDDWLDVKRNKSDVQPVSLQDLQAILDNNLIMNSNYPMLGFTGSDNLYVPDDRLGNASANERNAYLWAKDIYANRSAGEFSTSNTKIAYANIVLERVALITADPSNQLLINNIKGQALFLRALSLYHLSQLFCKPYQKSTAQADPGIQLRLHTNPNEKVLRSTVQETYEQMLKDVKEASALLPLDPVYPTRASKVSAFGLLAKIYLVMADYEEALKYAQDYLAERDELLDYNSSIIDPNSSYRFPPYSKNNDNPEIIFYAAGSNIATAYAEYGVAFADTLLYQSYTSDDMRRELYFRADASGLAEPVGRYTGSYEPFTGIATNEILLIRAECNLRLNHRNEGLQDLNRLLSKRYRSGTFGGIEIENPQAALFTLLIERRKELAFTGQTRWEDLRRLNLDPSTAVTLSRASSGVNYLLPPNDPRYILPFPVLEIELTGITQNER